MIDELICELLRIINYCIWSACGRDRTLSKPLPFSSSTRRIFKRCPRILREIFSF